MAIENENKDKVRYPFLPEPECGAGWAKIINDFCQKTEAYLKTHPLEDFRVDQIKEKFGGLRIYFSPYDEQINTLQERAELLSRKTCEICGKRGKLNTNRHWIKTLCNKHWNVDIRNTGKQGHENG